MVHHVGQCHTPKLPPDILCDYQVFTHVTNNQDFWATDQAPHLDIFLLVLLNSDEAGRNSFSPQPMHLILPCPSC